MMRLADIKKKEGFTLMEILFVLLVIALIVSFAVPAFRSVRFDVKNSRAKNALKKLAEARRSFYQSSKGSDIAASSFVGTEVTSAWGRGENCNNPAASGIPASSRSASPVEQLFACGFLDWKDFAGLPYQFTVCPLSNTGSSPCSVIGSWAGALGTAEAGPKYQPGSNYAMYIDKNMQVRDNAE